MLTLTSSAHTWASEFANTRYGFPKADTDGAVVATLATTPTPVVDGSKLTIKILEDWVYDSEQASLFEAHFTIGITLKTNNLDATTDI